MAWLRYFLDNISIQNKNYAIATPQDANKAYGKNSLFNFGTQKTDSLKVVNV